MTKKVIFSINALILTLKLDKTFIKNVIHMEGQSYLWVHLPWQKEKYFPPKYPLLIPRACE